MVPHGAVATVSPAPMAAAPTSGRAHAHRRRRHGRGRVEGPRPGMGPGGGYDEQRPTGRAHRPSPVLCVDGAVHAEGLAQADHRGPVRCRPGHPPRVGRAIQGGQARRGHEDRRTSRRDGDVGHARCPGGGRRPQVIGSVAGRPSCPTVHPGVQARRHQRSDGQHRHDRDRSHLHVRWLIDLPPWAALDLVLDLSPSSQSDDAAGGSVPGQDQNPAWIARASSSSAGPSTTTGRCRGRTPPGTAAPAWGCPGCRCRSSRAARPRSGRRRRVRCRTSRRRRRTWRTVRSRCRACRPTGRGVERTGLPHQVRLGVAGGVVAGDDRVAGLGQHCACPATSSEPNGWLPPARASAARAIAWRRWPSSSSVTGTLGP